VLFQLGGIAVVDGRESVQRIIAVDIVECGLATEGFLVASVMSTFISGETGGVCPMLNTDMLGHFLKHHETYKSNALKFNNFICY
jgi:hypothetical protein